jgi:hypothetical protein
MKVNENSQLALRLDNYTNAIIEDHKNRLKSRSVDEKDKALILLIIHKFITNKSKKYLLSDTALQSANSIKFGDSFDFKFLSNVIDGTCVTFMLGSEFVFKYQKIGKDIFGLQVNVTKYDNTGKELIKYRLFKIDTETGDLFIEGIENNPLADKEFSMFIKLVIFTELAELKTVIIQPGKTSGNTRSSGKFANGSKYPIVSVDVNWTITTVRTTGFKVKKHMRIQPCGKSRMGKKLIWIEEYDKDGYIRRSGKERTVGV